VIRYKRGFYTRKLLIKKTWPIKAFISFGQTHDESYWEFELKSNYPKDYLLLFEAIFNSKLAEFYLEVKYRLREEGNPEINVDHINHFPIPDLDFNYRTIKEIVEIVKSLKSPDLDGFRRKELQAKLNWS